MITIRKMSHPVDVTPFMLVVPSDEDVNGKSASSSLISRMHQLSDHARDLGTYVLCADDLRKYSNAKVKDLIPDSAEALFRFHESTIPSIELPEDKDGGVVLKIKMQQVTPFTWYTIQDEHD